MPKIRMERTHHSLITGGVNQQEQTLAHEKPFWVLLVANIGVSVWLMGVLLAGMGLNFTDAMFVLLIGSIIGSTLPAVTAVLGPLDAPFPNRNGAFFYGPNRQQASGLPELGGALAGTLS